MWNCIKMKLSHSKKKDRGSIAVCILQSRKVFFFRENDDDRLCQSKHFAQGRPKHLHTENETRKSSNFLYFFFFSFNCYRHTNKKIVLWHLKVKEFWCVFHTFVWLSFKLATWNYCVCSPKWVSNYVSFFTWNHFPCTIFGCSIFEWQEMPNYQNAKDYVYAKAQIHLPEIKSKRKWK